jgi:hypothetical protein
MQARFLRLALGTADTEGLSRSHLGKLRQQNTEVWPLAQEALAAHRREIARLKRELNAETSSLKQEREQIQADKERLAGHWALFYREKNASSDKERAEDPDYNTDDDDVDTRSDYEHFFGREEESPSFSAPGTWMGFAPIELFRGAKQRGETTSRQRACGALGLRHGDCRVSAALWQLRRSGSCGGGDGVWGGGVACGGRVRAWAPLLLSLNNKTATHVPPPLPPSSL